MGTARRLFVLSLASALALLSQDYDLLLKGGHVIDQRNGIDQVMDVAWKGYFGYRLRTED